MIKPEYFVENQVRGQTSRHTGLNPSISTMIIIGHVKDGYELGLEYNLPEPILDLIQQHHGTSLVEYFYREATKREAVAVDPIGIHESSFRYPGPAPQSREAAVLMISDAVESASRTRSEPTPARLEAACRDQKKPHQIPNRALSRSYQISRNTNGLITRLTEPTCECANIKPAILRDH